MLNGSYILLFVFPAVNLIDLASHLHKALERVFFISRLEHAVWLFQYTARVN